MAAAAGRHGGVNTTSFHSGGGGRGRHGQLGGACEQSVRAVVVGLTATGAAVVTDCMHGAAAVAAVTTVSAWAAVVLVRPHSLWYSALLFLLARAEAPCTSTTQVDKGLLRPRLGRAWLHPLLPRLVFARLKSRGFRQKGGLNAKL